MNEKCSGLFGWRIADTELGRKPSRLYPKPFTGSSDGVGLIIAAKECVVPESYLLATYGSLIEMPWTPDDAERHTRKATTWALKELWAKVANESLERTGDEGRAVREANAVVARQVERL